MNRNSDLIEPAFRAMTRQMVENGYPIKVETIRQYYATWKAGEDDVPDIIFMFAKGQFEEHPEIFGKPDKVAS